MKNIIKHSWAPAMLVVLCAALSSFALPGAHSFQVYIDSKLVADQYVTRNTPIPKVAIDPTDNNNEIVVKYSECGRTVSGRVITIKDEQDKILKEWSFEGTTSAFKDPMRLKVKDIVALKSKGTLKLFYSSNDFKEGQQFASLIVGKNVTASTH
jgi:hypothetical protein